MPWIFAGWLVIPSLLYNRAALLKALTKIKAIPLPPRKGDGLDFRQCFQQGRPIVKKGWDDQPACENPRHLSLSGDGPVPRTAISDRAFGRPDHSLRPDV